MKQTVRIQSVRGGFTFNDTRGDPWCGYAIGFAGPVMQRHWACRPHVFGSRAAASDAARRHGHRVEAKRKPRSTLPSLLRGAARRRSTPEDMAALLTAFAKLCEVRGIR